jgi:selenocysteine lyase/cysteine desulfurase
MKLQDNFPLTNKLTYFDNAVMGCVPESTLKVINEYTKAQISHMRGNPKWSHKVDGWGKPHDKSKEALAKVIGAKPKEIACIPNATIGINTVMNMLPIKKGDNLVSTDLQFPMGLVVLNSMKKKGAKTRYIKGKNGIVETMDFERAIDDNTAVVYIDHPGWFNGLLFDLKALAEIAHDHGAYFLVDATQSMGALDLQIADTGVDFAVTSTYKWLLGGIWPISCGFLYMREEHIDDFQPPYVGEHLMKRVQIADSVDGYTQYEFKPNTGIHRYEIYRIADVSYFAVENSMRVLLKHGIRSIENQNKKLGTRLVNGLLEAGYELQTPVEENWRSYVNVRLDDPEPVVLKLREKNIWVSNRVGGLRIAPHFYNKVEEVDLFIEKLNEALR